MNIWFWAALVLLASLILCFIACFRGEMADRLVGLEMASALVTLELLLLAEGLHRAILFDVPLTLALLSFGNGMVFARFLERYL